MFCCSICTDFWKKNRSKEALEGPQQCQMSENPCMGSRVLKKSRCRDDMQKSSFCRPVPSGNAIFVFHLEASIFRKYTFWSIWWKKMKKDEVSQENNARRVGQTHDNKNWAFSAYRFTCTGMRILRVKIQNVAFPIGKVMILEATIYCRAWPLHQ